jgi:hypothetical protein
MAIVTLKGHVARAKRFMEQDDVYIAIGKSTPWGNESQPNLPTVESFVEELIAMKKAETKVLAVQDDEHGTIQYMDHKYTLCTVEEAYERGARWVYCYCGFEYSELPVNISYRQVALQSGVVRKSTVPVAQYVLLPGDIEDVGISEILDNIQPIYRRVDKKERIGIIVEF